MKECKRILHVVSAMNRGGAETMIMNLYRKIDRKIVQFDFLVHSDDKGHFDDEILSLGGRIIRCNSLGSIGPIKYIKEVSNLIKNNGPFHVVHSHTDFQGGFVAIAAKIAGISKRICHSHNTKWLENPTLIHRLQLIVFRQIINIYATGYCACGADAAQFLFNNKNIDLGKVEYLNNGIDVDKFNINQENEYLKLKLDIKKDEIVIGHIGRFYDQKNHEFIIKIAKYMKERDYKFKIFLVGEGPKFKEIFNLVEKNNLSSNVKFLGVREDIPNLMHVFNVFLFPSFFEGLPVVLVEAQASGLPCVISNTITKEVDLGLNLIHYCDLNDDIEIWVDEVIKHKNKK